MKSVIKYLDPDTDEVLVVYLVRLDKRTGLPTKEAYEAERDRLIAQGEQAGRKVTVKETA